MNLTEIKELTGLPFKQSGSRFYSSTYLDGTPHERPDKTNARVVKGVLFISEEGGDSLPIKSWLEQFGDSSKYVRPTKIEEPPKVQRKFVSPMIYQRTFPSVYSGNLYQYLSGIFGATKVHETFLRYSVGADNKRDVVFWYRNELGQWLHDSIVPYKTDGGRDKSLKMNGWRKCKSSIGYTGRGVFGGHLLKDHKGEVCVVESEKTALIMSMVDTKGRLWVACGGSNKTAYIKEGWLLFPDFDQAGSFFECLGCENKNKLGCIIKRENGKRSKEWGCEFCNEYVRHWFEGLEVSDGDDPADYVIKRFNKK